MPDATDKPRRAAGRPSRGLTRKIVVKITPALEDAIEARVKAANDEAQRKGSVELIDRSAIVRACLAKCFAAELRDLAQRKPATSKP